MTISILRSTAFCIIALLMFMFSSTISLSSDGTKKVSLVLVGHGGVPKDFPKLKEFFQMRDKGGDEFDKIEEDMKHWPRSEKNDAYWAGFMKIVGELEKLQAYYSVHPSFNEFTSPTVNDALTAAVSKKPDIIIVTSIMLTPGGVHSERDIPASIETFANQNPDIKIVYAWPYDMADISRFVNAHAHKFIQDKP